MRLPEIIPVRYTEEEAGYVSVRPVVQQNFGIHELADMVVRVTGKDEARIRQVLRAGTVVYNGYRYWWAGFEPEAPQLAALLATFPDDDPSRVFHVEHCTAVLLEIGGGSACRQIEISRAEADNKHFWQKRSTWAVLLPPEDAPLSYAGYSHAHRGDLYRRSLEREDAVSLLLDFRASAPRALRIRLASIPPPCAVTYLCPREGAAPT